MMFSPLDIAIGLISIPYQLVHNFMWTIMDFIAFDVMQLGPFLPITF